MHNTDKYRNPFNGEYLTRCPICGYENLGSDLFCEKCGMRIHNRQLQTKQNKDNQQNQIRLTSANITKPSTAKYGMHKLSEMPDLKMVIDKCKSSINTTDAILGNLIIDYKRRILDNISDIIAGDSMDIEIFDSLGINFIEERDFGIKRCTEAAKEIFNLGILMSWSNLSQQQRMEISGVYANEVSEAFELVRYKGIEYKNFPNPNTFGANNGDGVVYLSNKLACPDQSPLTIIDTITHELRHQYQHEVVELGAHNVPEDVAKEWAIATQIYSCNFPCSYNPWGYRYNALEIDARYAGETVVRNISHDLFNAKSVEKKNEIDLQQLRKSLIQEGYSGPLLEQTIKNLLKLDGKAVEMLYSWLKHGTVPEFDQIEGVSSTYLRDYCCMKEPAIILSYGLLMKNPLHNSKFLKNQFNNGHKPKANLRSRYIFYEERDFNNAKNAIYYGNRSIYDKLDWYGSWSNINGRDCVWRVDLFDNLTQDELEYAVGHIREHNGRYYKD